MTKWVIERTYTPAALCAEGEVCVEVDLVDLDNAHPPVRHLSVGIPDSTALEDRACAYINALINAGFCPHDYDPNGVCGVLEACAE